MEKVKTIDAHEDFIRHILVHPTLPIFFTSSDDSKMKQWNYEKNFECEKIYDEHVHYVMKIALNPKDTNIIATASLDKSVKVWNII